MNLAAVLIVVFALAVAGGVLYAAWAIASGRWPPARRSPTGDPEADAAGDGADGPPTAD